MLQEAGAPTAVFHPLTARDTSQLTTLAARLADGGCSPAWTAELDEMAAAGLKADIEAIEHEELMRQLKRRMLQHEYLPAS